MTQVTNSWLDTLGVCLFYNHGMSLNLSAPCSQSPASLSPKAPLWCHAAQPALHSWLLKFTVKPQQVKYLMCLLYVFIPALYSPSSQ